MLKLLNNKGFTLIEMLIVLMITLTVVGSITAVGRHIIQWHETNNFFELLLKDILYAQNLARANERKVTVEMFPYSRYYKIKIADDKEKNYTEVLLRKFPQTIEVERDPSTLLIMTYTSEGTITKAGTVYFQTVLGPKKLVANLGKGRVRIE